MYFIFLRFFGCTEIFNGHCSTLHNNACTLSCVERLPVVNDQCMELNNFQVEVSQFLG
jgi:hypothetical protein